jgi:hypothetical protein
LTPESNIRYALVLEPIVWSGKGFVEDIVEVPIVGKYNVSANIEQLVTDQHFI